MAPTTLNESRNGSTVKVKEGEPIVIELPGNPTTGYSWFREGMLDADDPNCDLFSIKKSYGQSPSGLGMMGAGGTFTFEVTAKQTGSHPLKLVYVRPWVKDQPPEKTFSVQIDSTAL